jgi:hypothetical protein
MGTGNEKLGMHGQRVRLASGQAGGRLDPTVDFERYRKAACKQFSSKSWKA